MKGSPLSADASFHHCPFPLPNARFPQERQGQQPEKGQSGLGPIEVKRSVPENRELKVIGSVR
jgi:hypothetical protein